ncbi:MAG: amidohydrolase family protein [Candidatus Binatia bacterium]
MIIPSTNKISGCFLCNTDETVSATERGIARRHFLSGSALAGATVAAAVAGTSSSVFAQKTATREQPPHRDCIIEAPWVLTYSNDKLALLHEASVRIRGDRIEEVKAGRIAGNTRRVRAQGQLLLPGFISGHTHTCSGTPTRGLIESGRSYARPLEIVETLSDDERDALTAYNLAELLRSGCTTQVEMSLSLRQAQSYVRVAKRWGVRGYPGGMIPGIARLFPIWFRTNDQVLHDSVQGTLKEIEANRRFAMENNNTEEGRIRPQMSPHATDTHTPETIAAILMAAKELGNGLHIHLSQGAGENTAVQRLWKKRPVEWLEGLDFYSQRVFAAHLIAADPATDFPILARNKVTFAHCPSANGAGGSSGSHPYPEALAAGVNTSIGIDTHSNDYVENIKLAVLYGRARVRLLSGNSAVPLKAPSVWDAIESATLRPAQGLGRDDLGRIAPGAKADLCTIDVNGFLTGVGTVPPEPLNNLLYANGLSVRHVMTDGNFQVYDGRLVVDDEARVIQGGGAVVAKIWEQLRAEKWFEG